MTSRRQPTTVEPHLNYPYYLAHCAISPLRDCVRSAMRQSIDHFWSQGMVDYSSVADHRESTKACLARLFGGNPTSYAFVPNASHGINHIAHGVNWQPKDTIVLFKNEFPTNIRPWLNVAKMNNLDVKWLDVQPLANPAPIDLAALEALLREGIRVVAMSAVQFQSGARMPLKAVKSLCQRYGTLLFVDAIQACGATPFDGSALDFWVSGGHKWMLGPEGTGFLYVNPKILDQLRPSFVGWLSLENPLDFLFEGPGRLNYQRPFSSTASRFELGTHNTIGLAGLRRACEELEAVGIAQIYEHIQTFFDALEPRLQNLGFESLRHHSTTARSTILSFNAHPTTPHAELLRDALKAQIVVTAPDGCLRIAPHYWNPLSQVDHIVDTFKTIVNP